MTYPPLTESTTQTINFSWAPKDAGGNLVPIDATPVFTMDVAGVVNLRVNNTTSGALDGIKAGVVNITATGTSFGVPLTETFQVTVNPDAAVTFNFSFAAPTAR